jgi:mannose-6-phosphate isomerase-like protein (cupin superfamily)
MPQRPSRPVNLTAASESMSWDQACQIISVTGTSETATLAVHGMAYAEIGRQNSGECEMVYVVVAGFGVLRGDDFEMQCTAGDVLFVPRGCRHNFERLDGDMKIWRVAPVMP